MSTDTITTAAELDALPVASVVRDPESRAVWQRGEHLWFTAAVLGHTSQEMMQPPCVYELIYRPDVEPARTNPTEERVREAIESALGPTCPLPVSALRNAWIGLFVDKINAARQWDLAMAAHDAAVAAQALEVAARDLSGTEAGRAKVWLRARAAALRGGE